MDIDAAFPTDVNAKCLCQPQPFISDELHKFSFD